MLTKAWLLQRVIICILLASILGMLAYTYWDRAIVLFLAAHHAREWPWMVCSRGAANILSKLTEYGMAPCLLYFTFRISFGSLKGVEKKLLIGLIALIIGFNGVFSNYVRAFLGRAWPATWTHHNPSFLTNHVYGFHLDLNNNLFCTFPSGHALIAALLATFCWYYFPRWRWLALIYSLFVMFVMVIQYYHFLSDVIVGAAIGYLTMIYTYYATKQHILELK